MERAGADQDTFRALAVAPDDHGGDNPAGAAGGTEEEDWKQGREGRTGDSVDTLLRGLGSIEMGTRPGHLGFETEDTSRHLDIKEKLEQKGDKRPVFIFKLKFAST